MNEKHLQKALEHLAEELVPANTDLWPAIRAHFETSKRHFFQGDILMKTELARRQRLAFTILFALLLVTALLFATPQGRAWAQNMLQFFTRAETDQLPVQAWQLTPASETAAPDPASIIDADPSIAAVEQQAGYPILQPTWLPETLTFAGATLEPENKIVRLFYRYVETNGLVLREERFTQTDACALCGMVGESAAVEPVQIGGNPGEYVRGVWKLTDAGPVWEADPYLQTLRWQANGMAFELQYMGPPDALSKVDMIAVAASVE